MVLLTDDDGDDDDGAADDDDDDNNNRRLIRRSHSYVFVAVHTWVPNINTNQHCHRSFQGCLRAGRVIRFFIIYVSRSLQS